jgi:hypothetical protein
MPLGPKTKSPSRALICWSPTKTVSWPLMMYQVSSASRWMCSGGAAPRGSLMSSWSRRPSVCSAAVLMM